MAFATVLGDLELNTQHMAVSIPGFNLGIELMQMAVIIITMPWLILLGRTREYSVIRIVFATLTALASAGWILERVSGSENAISELLEQLTPYRIWYLCALAGLTVITYLMSRFSLSLREWVS